MIIDEDKIRKNAGEGGVKGFFGLCRRRRIASDRLSSKIATLMGVLMALAVLFGAAYMLYAIVSSATSYVQTASKNTRQPDSRDVEVLFVPSGPVVEMPKDSE